MPTHKVFLFQSGPGARVFFVKILARLRLSKTVLIPSAKRPGKIFWKTRLSQGKSGPKDSYGCTRLG
jgi:hypothetical protein